MPLWKRLPLALLLLALSLFLLKSTIQYAHATLLAANDTPPTLRQALQITPGNADWRLRLATLEPPNQAYWLDSALAQDPNFTLARIERGVASEVANNPAAAEADFLEAARRDHQYLPRWTLAAFYFRRHDRPKFQTWAHQALEMAYGDALPLFQMAAQLGMPTDGPDGIRQTLLPDRPPVYQAFLSHCLATSDFPAAAQAAQHLIRIGTATHDGNSILGAIGALFRANHISESVALWNQAANAHWFPHAALNPDAGPLVSNPEFNFEFLPTGFDWNHPTVDGVAFWRFGAGRGFQVELSHSQPESCTLVTLPLPVAPKRSYRLQISSHTEIPPASGLTWRIANHDWDAAKDLDDTFAPPDKSDPLYLSLVYNRAIGTKRLEGTLTIMKVTVGPAQ